MQGVRTAGATLNGSGRPVDHCRGYRNIAKGAKVSDDVLRKSIILDQNTLGQKLEDLS
jgi:hypothetical protein